MLFIPKIKQKIPELHKLRDFLLLSKITIITNDNIILRIDKKPQDWNAKDLINATNSPLYKYDQQLQNNAHDYIKYRAKHRFGGLF